MIKAGSSENLHVFVVVMAAPENQHLVCVDNVARFLWMKSLCLRGSVVGTSALCCGHYMYTYMSQSPVITKNIVSVRIVISYSNPAYIKNIRIDIGSHRTTALSFLKIPCWKRDRPGEYM